MLSTSELPGPDSGVPHISHISLLSGAQGQDHKYFMHPRLFQCNDMASRTLTSARTSSPSHISFTFDSKSNTWLSPFGKVGAQSRCSLCYPRGRAPVHSSPSTFTIRQLSIRTSTFSVKAYLRSKRLAEAKDTILIFTCLRHGL